MGIFTFVWGFFLGLVTSKIFWMIVFIDWCIGIAFVQYFYYRTKRLRNLNIKMKQQYAPFTNSPEKWNRLVHTLMSIFMIPRVIGFLTATITCTIAVWIILIGSEPKAMGWRRWLVWLFSSTLGRVGLFCGSYLWISYKDDDIDYSPWLGEDWKGKNKIRPPIIISNHRTWSDVLLYMTTSEFPCYVSSVHIRRFPFYGFLAQSYGSFFVQRGNEKSRNETVIVCVIVN